MIKKAGQYLLLASLVLMVGLVFYKYGTIFAQAFEAISQACWDMRHICN